MVLDVTADIRWWGNCDANVEEVNNTEFPPTSILCLWRFAKGFERSLIGIAVSVSALNGVVHPLGVHVFGQVLQKIYKGEIAADASVLSPLAAQFTILAFLSLVTTYVARAAWIISAERQSKRISVLYLKKILHLDLNRLDTSKQESFSTRLMRDVPIIRLGLGERAIGVVFTTIGTIISSTVVSMLASWKLSLILLSFMPIMIFTGYKLMKIDTRWGKISNDAYMQSSIVAEQTLMGIRTVSAFNLQERFSSRYDAKLQLACEAEITRVKYSGLSVGIFQGSLFLVIAADFTLAAILSKRGWVAQVDAVVVLFATMMLAGALMHIPEALSHLANAKAAACMVYDVIQREDDVHNYKMQMQEHKAPDANVGISFKAVNFSYPARPDVPILRGLTLDIQPGQTVAIVGKSGSGKSTALALIQRFYIASSGSVSVGGFPIESWDPAMLRDMLGVVPQESVLFDSLTIKNNILLGTRKSVTAEHFISICRMAQCHEFISKLPLGYDTPITNGMNFSGGQKQRIAIARALISDPRILILDEATSSLDSKSDRLVQKAMDAASQGRTTIIIAHRLSTVRKADMICVLRKGQVQETGTHDELNARGGTYAKLVKRQTLLDLPLGRPGSVDEDTLVASEPVAYFETVPRMRAMLEGPDLFLDTPEVIVEQTRLHLAEERARLVLAGRDMRHGATRVTRRVWDLLEVDRGLALWGILAAGTASALFPGFAVLLGYVSVDILKTSVPKTWLSCLGAVALYVFTAATLATWLLGKANARLTARLRSMIFQSLLRQDMAFFDARQNTASGILLKRLGGVEEVGLLVTQCGGELATLGFLVLSGLLVPLILSPLFAVFVITPTPVVFLASFFQARSVAKFTINSQEALDQSTQIASDAIRDVRTLKTFGREDFTVGCFEAFLEKPYRIAQKNALKDSVAYSYQAASPLVTLSYGLWIAQRLVNGGNLPLWQAISTILSVMVTVIFLARTSSIALSYEKSKHAAVQTFALIDYETKIDPLESGQIPAAFQGGFKFHNLAFQYPTASDAVFKGLFNLEAKPEQSIALVGTSGCGKSSIIALLERYYEAFAAEATVGTVPIRHYHLSKGLRANIAVVDQHPFLFGGATIRENIAWGSDRPVTDEEVVQVAKQAQVHEFLSALPDGYNTLVGNQSASHFRQLLLLDEALSALDSFNEVSVRKAIDRASSGRTTLTIAHRLSTIKNVDRIAVLHDGRVIEIGTHEELVALSGVYAEMCKQQHL
ncbi:hypothetical protein HKX48_005194 [Thoreauomyces humboldtii]|nr:hypothetical protein HKX48_005194 [Thoreauomyces humboldtii]